MKKEFIFILILGLIPVIIVAQDSNPRINEVGISLRGATSFGIKFKTGNEKTLFRITLLSASFSNTKSKLAPNPDNDTENGSIAAGLNIGIEKRKPITENICFFYGTDLINSYNKSSYESPTAASSSEDWTFSTGIGIVLGFIYKINSSINISAEVMPSIWYSYGKTLNDSEISSSERTNRGLDYSLVSPGANLTFAYRFGKKN
jgi:hypothetical protein